MRAAVQFEVGQPLEIVDDLTLVGPAPGEVRVRIEACGICHSDLSAIDGLFPVPLPVVLGHEAAGIVTGVGLGVTTTKPGDHVVLAPFAACGACHGCLREEPGTCVNTEALYAFAMPDGNTRLSRGDETVYRGLGIAAFADEVIVLEGAAVPIDKDVPLDLACLAGCSMQTGVGAVLNTANVHEGDSVLIVGLGGVGLAAVQGARLAGATTIIVSDPVDDRRDAAQRVGATHDIDPADGPLAETVRALTGGRGVDTAFEVVGRSSLVVDCIEATRSGGTTVMIGALALEDSLTIPTPVAFAATEKKLVGTFLGSCNPRRDIPRLLEFWKSGYLELDGMVSRRRPFDEINEAFQALRNQEGIRTVLQY